MSSYLLPTKSGTEQIPVRYKQYLPANITLNSVVTTISHNMLYIAASIYQGALQIYRLNLLTGIFGMIGEIQWSSIGSVSIGSILVDDSYIYISSVSVARIYVFDIQTLNLVETCQYSSSTFQAYGKMQWLNDTTIVCVYSTGVLLFDVTSRTYTLKSNSTSQTSCDFAVGNDLIVMNKSTAASNSILMYRFSTDTFTSITPTSNAVAVSAYENGKFYIACSSYLFILDETSGLITQTIAESWGATRSINVSNGTVFVTCTSSARLYIYDSNSDMRMYIILPWTVPAWNNAYTYIGSVQNGLFFYGYLTLCQVDYMGYSKYNFGPKTSNMVILYNTANQTSFTYDANYITFTDSYVTMHDGDITYPLTDVEDETLEFVKSASVHKSDYHIINSCRLIKSTS